MPKLSLGICDTHVSLITSVWAFPSWFWITVAMTAVLCAYHSIRAVNPSAVWTLRAGFMCTFRGQQMQMLTPEWKIHAAFTVDGEKQMFPEWLIWSAGQDWSSLALLWAGGWTRWTPKVPSNLHYSVILTGLNIWYTIRSACLSPASIKMTSLDRGSYVLDVCTGTDVKLVKHKTQGLLQTWHSHAHPDSGVSRPTWWQKY